jgi:phosphoglucosamine mutase
MPQPVPHPLGAPLGSAGAHFGTDGIRGRVGTTITPALALQVGYWCGRVLPEGGPVLIGTDSRSSGPMLVAALTSGLTAAGREVWQLGLCPTPAVPGTPAADPALPSRLVLIGRRGALDAAAIHAVPGLRPLDVSRG